MNRIGKPELRRQDLGLLVVLDALLAEGGVTGAAQRLHLSQPAVSGELQRLRAWIGDPLLVRVKGGYTLTARAQELKVPVQRILAQVQDAVRNPGPFESATATRRFRLATTDAFQLTVLPPLVGRLRREAPGVTLEIAPGPEIDTAALQDGTLDFCAGYYAAIPPALHSTTLFQERLVGLARRDHPLIVDDRPTLKQYAAAEHVAVAPQGNAFIALAQAEMAKSALSPKISLTLPHVLSAPLAAAQSDLVATVPRRVALAFASLLRLRVFEIPLRFPPFSVHAVWHERAHRDPALAWLRGVMTDVCRHQC